MAQRRCAAERSTSSAANIGVARLGRAGVDERGDGLDRLPRPDSLFDGKNPVTPEQFAAKPTGWRGQIPARDYSHSRTFWPQLNSLQFRRTDVPPPISGGPIVPGYYGFREIGGRSTVAPGTLVAPLQRE